MNRSDPPGSARVQSIQQALGRANVDAVVCGLGPNVLLLTGYWPLAGTSVAIATRDGTILVIVPEDERDLAERGWATDLAPFAPASLTRLTDPIDALRLPLGDAIRRFGMEDCRIGYEGAEAWTPVGYAAVHQYGTSLVDLVRELAPRAELAPVDDLLASLRSVTTAIERERILAACRVAELAFHLGAGMLEVGLSEAEAAARFRLALGTARLDPTTVRRADGFTYCMSGPNSALAYATCQRSSQRALRAGDLVLIHCNSYVEGYWTDITRTYSLGQPDRRQRAMFDAVLIARQAALEAIRAEAPAREVDRAARSALDERGYGNAFVHSTGHGVGLAAIDHNALPRLHPASDDRLEPGMVFNVEPAIYLAGYGGIRHCDMVALTATGPEVLTPFQGDLEELIIT